MSTNQAESWHKEILGGIDVIDFDKSVPGSILVHGEDATGILTTGKQHEVIIAASQFGHGRIVMMSHSVLLAGYDTDNPRHKQLLENIYSWIGKDGTDSKVVTIDKNTTIDDVNQADILISRGGKPKSIASEIITSVERRVFDEGAGLIVAVCPWGWLQLQPHSRLQDIPVAQITSNAGLSFTNDTVSLQQGRIKIAESKHEEAHLLQVCLAGLSTSKYTSHMKHANKLPPNHQRRLKEHIQETIASHTEKLSKTGLVCGKSTKCPEEKECLETLSSIYQHADVEVGHKALGVEHFPKDFTSCMYPNQQPITLEFDAKFAELHSTGFYLPAGEQIKLSIIGHNHQSHLWSIQIGAHSDNIRKKDEWKRYPMVVISRPLSEETLTFVSPFGGLVYFRSPNKPGSSLKVSVQNVLPAPYFDVTKPEVSTYDSWQLRRYSPGLWAEIGGKYIIFTLSAESVRQIDDPSEVIKYWDDVIEAHHELRTTVPGDQRRERVVCDIQPSAGYMHSGYPIVTMLDVSEPSRDIFLFNLPQRAKQGSWGLFHELGHNMQRKVWTFEGTGEVTCNIFTVHAMDKICGIKPIDSDAITKHNRKQKIQAYLENGADFTEWKKQPFVALGIYIQLAHHFGWSAYRQVFSTYEAMSKSELPNTSESKLDRWYTEFSKAVGFDLRMLFEFWGLPVSEVAKECIQGMPLWFPVDVLTKMTPARVGSLLEKYPNCSYRDVCNAQN